MQWWVWAIIGWIIITIFTLRFLCVCKRGREEGDRAAAQHFGYEYKREG